MNSSSDPRVYFAAERTLFAWVLTGIAGGDCVRVTPALYTKPADVDRLARGLRTLVTIFRPFTSSGAISGYTVNPWVSGFTDPVFTKRLVGRGTASGTFLHNDDDVPLFFATSLRTTSPTSLRCRSRRRCCSGATVLALRRRLPRRSRGGDRKH